MTETVKIVKGYKIERTIGTRGYYEVTLKTTEKSRTFISFRSAKAAVEYIEKHL